MDNKECKRSELIRETSSEVGEDNTKYGEFVSSYFAWISLPEQKAKAERLEKITKGVGKNKYSKFPK